MALIAALLKWVLENAKAVRYGALAFGLIAAVVWIYHSGSNHAARVDAAREVTTAIHVKEQYDEISNRRPDDHGVLELLRAGAF